jgi:hypothetical protein
MLVAPRRFLIVVHNPLPATPLVERRRYLLMPPRPMFAAPRVYLIWCLGRYPRRRAKT